MSKPLLCIYHGNCADGFGSAWVVQKAFIEKQIKQFRHYLVPEEIEFHSGVYGQEPPWDKIKDTYVMIVDFSYPVSEMQKIADLAENLTWIDHHKTAIDAYHADFKHQPFRHITEHISTERCGAYLTWDFFFGAQEKSKLLEYIDDRDRWQFKLPGSKEIHEVLFSLDMDFPTWDGFANAVEDDDSRFAIIQTGTALLRKHMKDIRDIIAACRCPMKIGGYDFPTVNIPYSMASDAGNIMAREAPALYTYTIGACYFINSLGEYCFSLRSIGDFDVSAVAKKYGGGGHKNAAGFTIKNLEELANGN